MIILYKCIGWGIGLVLIVALSLLLTVYNSWAIITMWEWFLTPWLNIRPPTLVEGMAIYIAAGLFQNVRLNPDTGKKEGINVLMHVLFKPIVIVALGYFLKGYM